MSTTTDLVEQLRSGTAPENIREFAAQGLLPIGEEDLIPIQVMLSHDSERRIAKLALATLEKVSEDMWTRLAEKKDPDKDVILYCLQQRPSTSALKEKILLNHSISDEIFRQAATTETGHLLDVILNNHVRLLRDSTILAALETNPAISGDQKRRIEEFKTEFIYKKQKTAEEPVAVEEPPVVSALDDLLAQIPNLDIEAQRIIKELEASQEEPPTDEQVQQTLRVIFSTDEISQLPGEIVSVYQRILKMKHNEKVRVALLGNKEERTLLIRDPSRQVASLVLRNPKLTDGEMDGFAQMRGIDSDLLRQMGQNREFVKRYSVCHALVKNPKTPSSISLNLLKLLREADLKRLEVDKNIPEIIRRQARKVKDQKTQKKGN